MIVTRDRRLVPVRFSEEFRAAVDQAVEKQPRAVSRNDWILEACRQRLEREADQSVSEPTNRIVEAVESRAPDVPEVRVPSLPLPTGCDPADPPMSMTHGGVTFVPDEWTAPTESAPVAVEPGPGVVLTVPDGRCSHKSTRSHTLFGRVCNDCNTPKTAW